MKLFESLAGMDARLITSRDNFKLGKAYARLGDYGKSLACLDKAAKQFALDPAPRTMVYRFLVNMEAGQVALKAGKSAKAMDYYREASKRSTSRGERSQALYSLARVYQAAGDAKKNDPDPGEDQEPVRRSLGPDGGPQAGRSGTGARAWPGWASKINCLLGTGTQKRL